MKFDKFDQLILGIVAILLVIIGGLTWWNRQPGLWIGKVYPLDGETTSVHGRIGIQFLHDMQPASVVAHFSVEPKVEGSIEWDGNMMWFIPTGNLIPDKSYRVTLSAGAEDQDQQKLSRDYTWMFQVRNPEIIYISPVGTPRELWSISTSGGQPVPLTQIGGKIFDFGVSWMGDQITYSLETEEKGADIWIMDRDGKNARRLVSCKQSRCSEPAWSPDGQYVAYIREDLVDTTVGIFGPPHIWTVKIATGETGLVYQDNQIYGIDPSWSPDGKRLASYDQSRSSIRILNLETGQSVLLQSDMGSPGSWSGDGQSMLFTNTDSQGSQAYVSVFKVNIITGDIQGILGKEEQNAVDFGFPALSPDQEWVMIGLRLFGGSPNRQIWKMRLDGGDAMEITHDQQYSIGAYSWSPDSSMVVFQRFPTGQQNATPDIMLWDKSTGELRLLAENAALPVWCP